MDENVCDLQFLGGSDAANIDQRKARVFSTLKCCAVTRIMASLIDDLLKNLSMTSLGACLFEDLLAFVALSKNEKTILMKILKRTRLMRKIRKQEEMTICTLP